MNKRYLTEMMLRQAKALHVMAAAMLDYSQGEGDEYHIHGIELQCAACNIESWVEVIEDEA